VIGKLFQYQKEWSDQMAQMPLFGRLHGAWPKGECSTPRAIFCRRKLFPTNFPVQEEIISVG
jgi:hypothetical protein